MSKRIWLTWEHQPRNISMSKALDCEYVYLHSDRRLLLRYLILIWKTFGILVGKKPTHVFCQNPSIVLSFLCVYLRRFIKYECIVDEHNAGLYPLDGKYKLLNVAADYIVRKADLLIVTNNNLKNYCEKLGGTAIVCPDPLPDMRAESEAIIQSGFSIMLVSSWASDEPYLNVIEVAQKLQGSGVVFYATGNPKSKLSGVSIPPNFNLTGYMSNEVYKATMNAVDAVMVLTLRDNCMNCGAYEAVSAGKPCIVSDNKVLRDYFYKGFEYTDNSVDAIFLAIESIRQNRSEKSSAVLSLRLEIKDRDVVYAKSIKEKLKIN